MPSRAHSKPIALAGAGVLLAVVFGRFGLGLDGLIPSHAGGDTALSLAAQRAFASAHILAGELPLWNPHTFGGAPFVGSFQSATLYPPNAIHLVLPLASAVLLEMVLHLLVVGLGTFAWLRARGAGELGAAFAGCAVAFGAPCLLRVTAGQLTVLDTLAWSPLLLLAVDRCCRRPGLLAALAGGGVAALMLLAGHPPTFFMAAVSIGLYSLAEWRAQGAKGTGALALASIPCWALALGAIQLFTGLDAASEGIRQGGVPFGFATSYSFPPENLLTLLVPDAFAAVGDSGLGYWGRWFYWDASAYIGVVAAFLAAHGALHGTGAARRRALWLAPLLLVIAFGRHAPLYGWLFYFVPGFDLIRAPSKFVFFAALTAAPLISAGVDRLEANDEGSRSLAVAALVGAFALGALGLYGVGSPADSRDTLGPLAWLLSDEAVFAPGPGDLLRWRDSLVQGAFASAGLCGLVSLLFLLRQRASAAWVAPGLVALGVAELVWFAQGHVLHSRIDQATRDAPAAVEAYRRAGDERVFEVARASNVALAVGGFGLWGYDPMLSARYGRFIAGTQGLGEGHVLHLWGRPPERWHDAFRLLRVRYAVREGVDDRGPVPPRFSLLRRHRVVSGASAALEAVLAPGFDSTQEVILERPPLSQPGARASGADAIRVLAETTDRIDLALDVAEPAILLVRDAWAAGWRARPLPDEDAGDPPQPRYELQPADYILRGLPLVAGSHRVRLEYSPPAFRLGAGLSGLALLAYLVGCLVAWRRRVSARPCDP